MLGIYGGEGACQEMLTMLDKTKFTELGVADMRRKMSKRITQHSNNVNLENETF